MQDAAVFYPASRPKCTISTVKKKKCSIYNRSINQKSAPQHSTYLCLFILIDLRKWTRSMHHATILSDLSCMLCTLYVSVTPNGSRSRITRPASMAPCLCAPDKRASRWIIYRNNNSRMTCMGTKQKRNSYYTIGVAVVS